MKEDYSVFFEGGEVSFGSIEEAEGFYLGFLEELLDDILENYFIYGFLGEVVRVLNNDTFIVSYNGSSKELEVWHIPSDEDPYEVIEGVDDYYGRKSDRVYIAYTSFNYLLDIRYLENEIKRLREKVN